MELIAEICLSLCLREITVSWTVACHPAGSFRMCSLYRGKALLRLGHKVELSRERSWLSRRFEWSKFEKK